MAGDVKDVAEGYGRNFLLPKKLAEYATGAAIEKAGKIKQEMEELKNKKTEELKKIAKILEGKEITIKAREKDGKLFGSIGKKEIAQKLREIGFEPEEKTIILEEPIKKTGKIEISVDFGGNTKAKVIVNVAGE